MRANPPEVETDIPAAVAAFMEREAVGGSASRGVLAAVSGGADSVALLLALRYWRPRADAALVAVHLNHGLRGADSDSDEIFVHELCVRLGIKLHSGRTDIEAERRPGESLEMAARSARLVFFRKIAAASGYNTLVLGHHRDDRTETLLMRLSEGAGATGLAGIKPVQEFPDGMRILRPLLPFSREDLRAWLREQGQDWREDASNAAPEFFRNRVRHEWIPWLRAHGRPGLSAALARSAVILGAEDELLDSLAARAYRRRIGELRPGISIRGLNAAGLSREPLALRRRLALRWLFEEGGLGRPDFETVERLLRLADGTHPPFTLPGNLLVRREAGWITASPATGRPVPCTFDQVLAIPGETEIPEIGRIVIAKFQRGIVRDSGPVGKVPASVSLDAGFLAGRELRIRNRRPGDRIRPTGLDGSRKLQDVFVDAGIPRQERACIPVLVCGEEILWLPGYRLAHPWRVRDARRRALRIVVVKHRRDAAQKGEGGEGSRET